MIELRVKASHRKGGRDRRSEKGKDRGVRGYDTSEDLEKKLSHRKKNEREGVKEGKGEA